MKRLALLLILSAVCVMLDFCFSIPGLSDAVVTASVLGTLITGAGVQTTFAGQATTQEYLVVGDVDTANALRGITVEIDGTPFINIQNSEPLVGAFARWQMQMNAALVGLMFKLGTGNIKRNTTYRLTNDGATTPTIRVFSDSQDGIPFVATTLTINASSFADFDKFSALMITLPANVQSAEINWADGYKDTLTIEEVDAYFSLKNQALADGRLNGVSVIDNRDQSITSVRLYAAATAITVLVIKVPDAAWKLLKQAVQNNS